MTLKELASSLTEGSGPDDADSSVPDNTLEDGRLEVQSLQQDASSPDAVIVGGVSVVEVGLAHGCWG